MKTPVFKISHDVERLGDDLFVPKVTITLVAIIGDDFYKFIDEKTAREAAYLMAKGIFARIDNNSEFWGEVFEE